MKRLVCLLAALIALVAGLTLPATADSDTVTATVSPIMISVNVSTKLSGGSPEPLDYGSVLLGAQDVAPVSGSPLDVKNTGTVNEDLSIKGFDTEKWTLASSPGPDQYVHKFSTSGTAGSFNPLTTAGSTLWSGVAPNGIVNVHLRLSLPTSSSSTSQQHANVQVLVTGHTP